MGTELEPSPVNDNGLHWRLKGPDADGAVWLVWEGDGPRQALNLGTKEQVHGEFVEWQLDNQ